MKTKFHLLFLTIIISLFGFIPASNVDPNDITGIYWSPKKDGKIELYKRGNKYYGKTIWGKNKKDTKNPDSKLRDREIIGLEFLRDFVFDGKDEWVDGTVYDPQSGKTYSCKMWLEDGNLKLKGYIGVSLLGRTETLERIK